MQCNCMSDSCTVSQNKDDADRVNQNLKHALQILRLLFESLPRTFPMINVRIQL